MLIRLKFVWPLLLVLAAISWQSQAEAKPNIRAIERQVLILTNELRREHNKAPYQELNDLNDVARFHSSNMAQHDFFSHTDPAGRSPSDRLHELKPMLMVGGAGENIAYNYARQGSAQVIAQRLVHQWKNSPGHYRNMMGGSTHMGVGIAYQGDRVYATQIFSSPVARFTQAPPTQAQQGEAVRLHLEYLAAFPRSELYFYLKFPNKNARFATDSGSYYTGGGPLKPRWQGQRQFVLELPTDKGLGLYHLNVGRQGRFSPSPYSLNVRAAQQSQVLQQREKKHHNRALPRNAQVQPQEDTQWDRSLEINGPYHQISQSEWLRRHKQRR